jgi:hypothetical protein
MSKCKDCGFSIGGLIFLIMIYMILGFFIGLVCGSRSEWYKIEKEAIEAGVGHYIVETATTTNRFEWIKK